MKICGRTAKCTGGHSAVEQSGYISREIMYSEYDGKTYYPKYAEDLVHNEVLLPENAPEEYKDPKKLWNSVEMFEKKDDAQLARTWRIELPNNWTYKFAIMFLRELCKRLFVSKGMCVQFAIHDSENDKGQRNLHAHIMLTMRSIDEQGHWMPKQKKVYLTDENGEHIPVIDEKTGQQKVDKRNRKQWKCTTIKTNDWDDKKYGKLWRKELTDAINSANAELGMTENHWEHRSFKEQGLDIIPQIHLREKASAMERAGIKTIRGDINRDIIARNAIINAARAAYEKAKVELAEVVAIPVTVIKTFKSENVDMIRKMAERNNNRLTLPVMKGKFIGAVSDRASLQDKDAFSFRENSIVVTIPFERINKVGNKVGKKVGDKKPLNSRRQKIISEMRDNPNITTAELHNILGVSETAVEKNISFLRDNGYIERVGSKRAGYWKVL